MTRNTAESVVWYSQADWVEAARFATVMKGVEASRWPALAGVVALTLLVYPYVSRAGLAAMLGISFAATMARHVFVRGYQHVSQQGGIADELAYQRKWRAFWALSAVAWGLWPLLFHNRLPLQYAVGCWTLIAGVGGVAIAWISAHLGVARIFLMSLLVSVVTSMTLKTVLWPEYVKQPVDFWFPVFLGAYWLLLLLRIANHLNALYHDSIDLAYHNARLIHSLREQKHAVEEASRFKDRFLAGAAHDLKQPVNALGIYAEWLSSEPELVAELGPKILQCAGAVNALFDSMFDLVKLHAEQIAVNEGTIDVAAMLDELAVQFAPGARQKDLVLRVRSLQATLRSDPILLRRILGNLLSNAIRYTARGGVLLTARRRDGGICFEVWDTGIGIPEHAQAQIFEEFYKVQTQGTTEGFGLGLSIVRRLAQRLGCTVSMRSRSGRGTVFRVWVPLQPAVEFTSSADHSSARSAGSVSGS